VDAFTTFAFGFSGLGFGLAGFTFGRIQRELRYRRDSRRNLALANSRADARARAVRSGIDLGTDNDRESFPFGVSFTDSDSDSDSDSPGGTLGPVHSSPGRRAILGTDGRSRPRRYVAGRTLDFPNEAALVGSRRAVEYDG
jgi:hypothetical protein